MCACLAKGVYRREGRGLCHQDLLLCPLGMGVQRKVKPQQVCMALGVRPRSWAWRRGGRCEDMKVASLIPWSSLFCDFYLIFLRDLLKSKEKPLNYD